MENAWSNEKSSDGGRRDGDYARHQIERSDSSSASSMNEVSTSQAHTHTATATTPHIHAPVPTRPNLPSRKSSGTIIVPRDSLEVGPVETKIDPNDVRAMSPRRNCDDIQALGKEAREELRRHAKALQDSLIAIFNRIEAVREEHDKLDNNNKFLQKYIGDLMSTSKITATSSSRGKK